MDSFGNIYINIVMKLISILLLGSLASVEGYNLALATKGYSNEKIIKRNEPMVPNPELVNYKYVCYESTFKNYSVCRWVYSENDRDFANVVGRTVFWDQYNGANKMIGSGLMGVMAIMCLIM